MSKSELVRFCTEYLPQHPELKQRINAQGDKQKLARGMAQAGAEAGYDFSELEILEVMKAGPSVELSDNELEAVAGGRKAGGKQEDYLIVKMTDILITG